MVIRNDAMCGTLESGDVQIAVFQNSGKGIEIELDSVVKKIFGDAILETVYRVLDEFQVTDIRIRMKDQGALDCVIRARMQAVILRAAGEQYDWSKEDIPCQER